MDNLIRAICTNDWQLFVHEINKIDISSIDNAIYKNLPPLALAAMHGCCNMATYLIEHCHATVDSASIPGRLAFRMASQYNHLDMLKVLIRKGADITSARNNSASALRTAARLNHTEVLCYLLEQGAYPDSQSGSAKLSAAHWAVKNDNLAMLEALVDAGANLELRTRQGLTIIDIAKNRNNDKILNYLHSLVKAQEQYKVCDENTSRHEITFCYNVAKNVSREILKNSRNKNCRDEEYVCHSEKIMNSMIN